MILGYKWILLAASSGHEDASKALGTIRTGMSAEEVLQASKLAEEWHPQRDNSGECRLDEQALYEDAAQLKFPTLIEHANPAYPSLPRVARLEGTVVLKVLVRKDGTVSDVCVLSATHEGIGFEESAIESILFSRWKPALYKGRPVDYSFSYRMEFDLK